jgi:Tol biopolymer transport system component
MFFYDFTTNVETQLTSEKLNDTAPVFSPDGKSLAFVRDRKELRVYELASKQERVVVSGYLNPSQDTLAWSPDSQWIAYEALSTKAFRNIFAVPLKGGAARAVSSLPNAFVSSLSRSPDGTYVLLNSNQRTEDSLLVRIDLSLRTPKFGEDQFRDLFKDEPGRSNAQAESPRDNAAPDEAKKDEKKPGEIVGKFHWPPNSSGKKGW